MGGLVLILLTLLIFSTCFFILSASEAALLSLNKYHIRYLAKQGSRPARLLRAVTSYPERLRSTLLFGKTLSIVGAASCAAVVMSRLLAPNLQVLGVTLGSVLLAALLLVLCGVAPRALGIRHAEFIAFRVIVPIRVLMMIFSPIVDLGFKVSNMLTAKLSAGHQEQLQSVQVKPEQHASKPHGEEVPLTDGQKLLHSLFEISDLRVKEVMTPRTEVTALEMKSSLEDVKRIIKTTGFSRIPVFRDTFDNVIGILNTKDVLTHVMEQTQLNWLTLIRRPIFVPDSSKIEKVLKLLQSSRTHMGIVVDEHGGIRGIVTLEDLLEQIVGEIQDEHDFEQDAIVPQPDGSILIEAGLSTREANLRLNLSLPENQYYTTLGGFLMSCSGKLPKEMEEIRFNDVIFKIEELVGRRIAKVRMILGDVKRKQRKAIVG